ncbi:MAG: hypothetical protein HQL51_15535 [Magnetococcales bacterium]|nr:hypothetical protein [Magnetococcales bacterium]
MSIKAFLIRWRTPLSLALPGLFLLSVVIHAAWQQRHHGPTLIRPSRGLIPGICCPAIISSIG